MSEQELQINIAHYIRIQYPDVLFHSDYGSGIKLTARQASIQKRQNGGLRGWPDMFIAEPRNGYLGLFIELKKEGTRLKKVMYDTWASDHIEEQAEVLSALNEKGYYASFACGFDEAKEIIDKYMGGKL